jgi:hypothetical protein
MPEVISNAAAAANARRSRAISRYLPLLIASTPLAHVLGSSGADESLQTRVSHVRSDVSRLWQVRAG